MSSDIKRFWTRSETAEYLGKSVQSIRWLEKTGRLHPTTDPDKIARGGKGYAIFDPDEVRTLKSHEYRAVKPKWSAGELSAEVFRAFDRNLSLPEIVDMFEVDPDRVAELYKMWRARDLDKVEQERALSEAQKSGNLQTPEVEPLTANVDGVNSRLSANPELERRWPSYYKPGQSPLLEAVRAAVTELDPDVVAGALVVLAERPEVRNFFGKAATMLAGLFGGGGGKTGPDPGAGAPEGGNPEAPQPPPPGGERLGGEAVRTQGGGGGVVGRPGEAPPGPGPDLGGSPPQS